MLSKQENDLINELRAVIYANDSSVLELKSIFKKSHINESVKKSTNEHIDDEDLRVLREFFDIKSVKKNAVIDHFDTEHDVVIEKPNDEKSDFIENDKNNNFDFIGTFATHPTKADELNFYKNYVDGIVFIYKNSKWVELIRDGQISQTLYGGGLGERDVIELIKEFGGTSTFNGSASAVSVDSTNFVSISGDDVQSVLNSINYKITTKVLFGEYKTLNMDEEGSIIYVGCESLSGDWYYKKIVTDDLGNITIGYANNYSTSSSYDYSQANINKHNLNYVTIKELGM